MAYLVRKISITRWPDGVNNVFKSVDEISADAIILFFQILSQT